MRVTYTSCGTLLSSIHLGWHLGSKVLLCERKDSIVSTDTVCLIITSLSINANRLDFYRCSAAQLALIDAGGEVGGTADVNIEAFLHGGEHIQNYEEEEEKEAVVYNGDFLCNTLFYEGSDPYSPRLLYWEQQQARKFILKSPAPLSTLPPRCQVEDQGTRGLRFQRHGYQSIEFGTQSAGTHLPAHYSNTCSHPAEKDYLCDEYKKVLRVRKS